MLKDHRPAFAVPDVVQHIPRFANIVSWHLLNHVPMFAATHSGVAEKILCYCNERMVMMGCSPLLKLKG